MTHPSLATRLKKSMSGRPSSRVAANRLFKAVGMGLVAVTTASAFVACSQDADTPLSWDDVLAGGNGGGAGEGGSAGGSAASCEDGARRNCAVTLEQQGDVLTCYHGVQTCQGGTWGTCRDGTVSVESAPKGAPAEKPGGGPQDVLTTCVNNPCDPTCRVFDEDPDGGVKSSGQTPIFTWQNGDLGGYPPNLVDQGIKQPCQTGYDCQFNQYCSAPAIGSAEHNICAVGDPLSRNTNDCVDLICPIEPSCCTTAYAGTCDHDYCDLGKELTKGCDTCVDAICNADPDCCGGSCAHSYCEAGSTLGTGCDTCVDDICAQDPKCCGLPTKGACSHDYCSTGSALNKNCDPCVNDICEADPKCCGLSQQGTCSHDYCASSGAALVPGCHPCVDEICVDNPKCCDWTPGTVACAHDYCSTGSKLDPACDPCVAAVCAVRPQCCTSSWNSTCRNLVASVCSANDKCPSPKWSSTCRSRVSSVCGNTCTASWGSTCTAKVGTVCGDTCTASWGQTCIDKVNTVCGKNCAAIDWDQSCKNKVASVCGKSCGPFAWDQSCVDKVGSVCGDVCYPDPPCSHNKCDSGGPLNAACDPCVATICAQLPSCCTTEWTNLCVDRVKTLCGEGCNVKGDCVPWLPAQKDPNCAGIDLTVSVPCNDYVPVCNHGNSTAPAGIRLVHFPAGSLQFPKCNPDQSHPQMQSCTTQLPIPPGKCINVAAADCGLGAGAREIMVNPPSWNGNVQEPECKCQDNWSLWAGPNIQCQAPNCSNTTTANVKRVNMFIQLDKSGSMGTNIGGGETRWSATIKALKKFVQDTGSAGLGVALRFWGDNSPVSGCNESTCSSNACKQPLVNLGVLKLATGAADAQEVALVNALNNKSPGGATPMYPALDGALKWAIDYKATHPTEETVVVIATDGEPNGCNESATAIANLAGAAFTNYGIKTYSIGIQDANPVLMNAIAQQGGTNKGFFVVPGANVENDLLSVMIQIKGDTLSCDFVVPAGGQYDPSVAVVTYTPSVGAPVTLTGVANLAACGPNNWYYDNPADPTQLKLCPTICSTILSDAGGQINVDLGCPADYEPVAYTYKYEAICPPGSKPQWGYLTYNTLTPADSKITWAVRSSPTLAGLDNASYTTVATAKASPDTQVCGMAGPSPCPINLFNELGGLPDARNNHLELMLTLYPATTKASAAIVNNWDITYSCPPSE
ncbi:MAG: VWA domain-containing protein [Polyangiaceae bacterium]|nr:VWA domain-containing protein [Polyangiaceae bacterium]